MIKIRVCVQPQHFRLADWVMAQSGISLAGRLVDSSEAVRGHLPWLFLRLESTGASEAETIRHSITTTHLYEWRPPGLW